jgi:4-hydroxy-2-oxoheptanedioate aldolase
MTIRQKLAAGWAVSVVSGHWTAEMIEFMGQFGLDGVWIECEHGPTSWEQIGDFSRAADLWGMDAIVRVQDGDPALITRTLDRGASGIVVPHVSTKAAAEGVVQAARFAPIGRRGMFGGRRSYGVNDYYRVANDETLVVVLIEEVEALDNLDAILAVDHIDVFQVASADLAQSMGHIGDAGHPDVREAVETTLRRIVASGRTAGMAIGGADPDRYLDLGVRFVYTSWNRWAGTGAAKLSATVAARNVVGVA